MIENDKTIVLKKLISSLQENSNNPVEAEKSLNEIHAHFQDITKITGFDHNIKHLAAVPAAKGKALGLNFAAQCLLDYKRTLQFLKAIYRAILEKQKNRPGETIKIFYAGCGPYAPFITLIASLFTKEELRFSVLEINEKSLDSAKKLIHSMGLSGYVQEFHLADAVTFKIPDPGSFHILISETLDALLYRECYVPILFNLLPQFNKNSTVIPENVLINLSLTSHSKEDNADEEHKVGAVFNVREALSSLGHASHIPAKLPEKRVDLRALAKEGFENILLETQVHIYDDIWLHRNESSLTVAYEIKLEQPLSNTIVFYYQLEPEIALQYTFQN
ncbi:MAG: putative RNA methylase [Patiriisocius sp.]|jgi:predicted RNA methylase